MDFAAALPPPTAEFTRAVAGRLGREPRSLELSVLAAMVCGQTDAEILGPVLGGHPTLAGGGEWVLALHRTGREAWARAGAQGAQVLALALGEQEGALEAGETFALGLGLPGLEIPGAGALALGLRQEPIPSPEPGARLLRLEGGAEGALALGAQARGLAGLSLLPAAPEALVAWGLARGCGLEVELGPEGTWIWGFAFIRPESLASMTEFLTRWGIRAVAAGGPRTGSILLRRASETLLEMPLALELDSFPAPFPDPAVAFTPRPTEWPADLGEGDLESTLREVLRRRPLGRPFGATLHLREGAESAVLASRERFDATQDPFWEGATQVAEAAQGVACVGAEALGVAIALPPEAPPSHLLGLRQACASLELPVLAIQRLEGIPAPRVVALGAVEAGAGPVDVEAPEARGLTGVGPRICDGSYRRAFDGLFLLGASRGDLGGSLILDVRGGWAAAPEPWLDEALHLQACVREGVRLGLIRSALGVVRGGLLPTALEGALSSGLGCHLLLNRAGLRLDSLCFGEAPGRVLVSVSGEGESALRTLARTHRVPFAKVGVVGGDRFTVAVDGVPMLDATLAEWDLRGGSASGRTDS